MKTFMLKNRTVVGALPWLRGVHIEAFTRLELLASVVALAALVSVALPALAGNKPRFDRVVCVNNLRQIGVAFRIWGNDHADQNPWWVPLSKGGTGSGTPGNQNIWVQCSVLTNALSSPKLLACPSDTLVRAARRWDTSPDGGFYHAANRDNSVSYALGLHANPSAPHSMLMADRNLQRTEEGFDPYSCQLGIAVGTGFFATSPTLGWTNALHGLNGNVLQQDGQVRQLSSAGLRELFRQDDSGEGWIHVLRGL